MILIGKNGVLGGKSVPVPHSSPQISHALTRDRNRAYEIKINTNLITYKDSSRTSRTTQCASIRKTNRRIFCKETIAVDSEHKNTLCGQNAEIIVLNLTGHILTTGL